MPAAISAAPGTSSTILRPATRRHLHEQQRADDRERRDDHVDPERPPPRVVGGEEPADDRADGDGDAGRRAPRRERGRAFPAVERAREDRERRGQHQRGADAFDDRFAEDELGHALRQRGDERSDAEQRGADDEDAAVAVHIAEPAADDEQRGERERVAGDDPLEARAATCRTRAGSSGSRRSAPCCRARR